MADEPNTPDHRWYERRNNIALSNQDLSRETIFDSGIQKINDWINSQPWGFDYPQLVLDFGNECYRVDGGDTTFSSAITHTRASTATYVDADGILQTAATNVPRIGHHVWNGSAWVNEGLLHESEARTNLLLNSGTLATQSVTVSAVAHTIHFTGTGTITLSGASTTGPLVGTGAGEGNRVSLTFTPIAAPLIITVTGTVTNAQLEVGPTPSSYIPTAGSAVTRAADVLTVPAANLPYPTPTVIGPELVTNGTFDTDTTGWTAQSGGILSWSNGTLVVTNPAGDNFAGASQTITTEAGSVYQISYDTVTSDVSAELNINDGATVGVGIFDTDPIAGTGTRVFYFVAQSAQTTIYFVNRAAGGSASFDNISVREINPLAVSIQMDGRVTYADENSFEQVRFVKWPDSSVNRIQLRLSSGGANTGRFIVDQNFNSVSYAVSESGNSYAPDILVPYNVAGRFGSNFLNGANDGVSLTAITTPVGLPDLSTTNLPLASRYNGTIRTFRMWGQDITDAGLVEATS